MTASPPPSPPPPPGQVAVAGLRTGADVADLAAFCVRVLRLDPRGLVRLRQVADRLTAYSRLPLEVLVSRTVHSGQSMTADSTLSAADLLATLEGGEPARPRDAEWRGTLPPVVGWRRLDAVPVTAVDDAVRAGMAAFDTVRGRPDASTVGESLLDHEALTVSDGGHRVVLPLRVLQAAWRMGFLGAHPGSAATDCAVSVAGGWARLAAPHGSAYHRTAPGLSLR
jgi:hypothetical protein